MLPMLAVVVLGEESNQQPEEDASFLLQAASQIKKHENGAHVSRSDPMLDGFDCTTAYNFMPGAYTQESLTDYCPTCYANPIYKKDMGQTYNSASHVDALAAALDYCKERCRNMPGGCSAFFFQKHSNGHEICGFYTDAVDLDNRKKDGHQECSQFCTRQKYSLGEHKTRTSSPICPPNSSIVTSADTCGQSAALLGMVFSGKVTQSNFPPGCYRLSSSGIWFNEDAGGDWHANTGSTGVSLVCSMDNSNTYSVGAERTKPAVESEPTCPTKAVPVTSSDRCGEYAHMVGKSFSTDNLPNYPRGCSDRIDHPRFAGVWWNTAEEGSWDQHQGFRGKVALVCEAATMESLDNNNEGCYLLTSKSQCLHSKDGRSGDHELLKDTPCRWCCGQSCQTHKDYKCEPERWLLEGQINYRGESENVFGDGNCP